MIVKISLSELKRKKKFIALAEENNPFIFELFTVEYKNFGGLPAYFIHWGEESIMDACSNNAADIVRALNEYFDVVLVP